MGTTFTIDPCVPIIPCAPLAYMDQVVKVKVVDAGLMIEGLVSPLT